MASSGHVAFYPAFAHDEQRGVQLSANEKLNLIARSNLVKEDIVVRLPCKIILRVFPLGFNVALYLAV